MENELKRSGGGTDSLGSPDSCDVTYRRGDDRLIHWRADRERREIVRLIHGTYIRW